MPSQISNDLVWFEVRAPFPQCCSLSKMSPSVGSAAAAGAVCARSVKQETRASSTLCISYPKASVPRDLTCHCRNTFLLLHLSGKYFLNSLIVHRGRSDCALSMCWLAGRAVGQSPSVLKEEGPGNCRLEVLN